MGDLKNISRGHFGGDHWRSGVQINVYCFLYRRIMNINIEEGLPLKEAFKKLIQGRKWYAGCKNPRMAMKDKYDFLKGRKIPEERLRSYLRAAGAECTQEEKWKLKCNE
jgi:hypothetical protein